MSAALKLLRATPAEAALLAQAHAGGFDAPWREEDFEDLLEGEGIFGFLATGAGPLGMILCRVAAGEVEVLTLAVTPAARRRGIAKALLSASLEMARQMGAVEAFLEVAVDNGAAADLYAGLGFRKAGVRAAYYDRGAAGWTDALVMRLDLNAATP